MKSDERPIVFNSSVLAVFAFLTLAGLLHHEIWLDEAHHWLLARDSTSIKHLWHNMRYEGHPVLWNVMLFGITRCTTDVIYMQLAHWMVIVLAAGVFLFFAPFESRKKFLFVMGYFMIYEYSVISRNYALLLLCLFCCIAVYRRKKYVLTGLALAFLSNTHLFGLVIASCFIVMATYELHAGKQLRWSRSLIAASLMFLVAAVISIWQVIPPHDSMLIPKAQEVPALERLGRTSAIFLKGFVPIPDPFHYSFWNTNLLMSVSKPLCALLSILIFCTPLFLFKRRLSLLFFFYAVAFTLLIFVFVSDLNAVRYYGIAYIMFVVCLWLSNGAPETRELPIISGLKDVRDKPVFMSLLFVQAAAGVLSLVFDISRPFSGSKEAAKLVSQEKSVENVVSGGCGAAPVSAYLGKKVFYLNQNAYGSFCYFNRDEVPLNSPEELGNAAIEYVRNTQRPALLIAHRPLDIPEQPDVEIKLVGVPANSTLRNENYHIYRVSRSEDIDR